MEGEGPVFFFSLGLSALRHFNLYDPLQSPEKEYLLGFAAPNFGGANYASNAVFRLERATEVLELTYLGKYFACVNAN